MGATTVVENAEYAITGVFAQFSVGASVVGAQHGPTITRYEVKLEPGTRVAAVLNLTVDIASALGTDNVRMLPTLPAKPHMVGIEVPNAKREMVKLGDVMRAPVMADDLHPLSVALGKDLGGEYLSANLGKMPHLLVAGSTGSGKSSFVNSMLVSVIARTSPADCRLILIDPKMVELTPYEGVPHLIGGIITDPQVAVKALQWTVDEMERRYQAMQAVKVRHIDEYNRKARAGAVDDRSYPYIVVVVDELADLMMVARKEIEPLIVRIGQKARAAGIHLVLATQRPSVDVVTGLIKTNVPSRIAFAAASQVDSRVVLDQNGAENLTGMGDGLFLPMGATEPTRFQGAYVSDTEIEQVVTWATKQYARA